MKKLLKILTTIAAVLTTAVVFATCKQFRDDCYFTHTMANPHFNI